MQFVLNIASSYNQTKEGVASIGLLTTQRRDNPIDKENGVS